MGCPEIEELNSDRSLDALTRGYTIQTFLADPIIITRIDELLKKGFVSPSRTVARWYLQKIFITNSHNKTPLNKKEADKILTFAKEVLKFLF